MAAAHPVLSKQAEFKVADKTIDIICTNYGNRVLTLISDKQMQKIGTILSVRREYKGPGIVSTFNVTTLLGIDSPEVHVFGRAIGGHILLEETPNTTLIVCLGIKDPDPSIIPSLLKQLDELNVWSTSNSH